MPISSDETRKNLKVLVDEEGRDAAWIARQIGKSHLWVWRRLAGRTKIQIDDYPLLLSAFDLKPGDKRRNRVY